MNIFYPDIYAKNIFEIDYEKLKSKGIKCLVFDLDNTLVPVKSSVADEKVKALFTTLKKQTPAESRRLRCVWASAVMRWALRGAG